MTNDNGTTCTMNNKEGKEEQDTQEKQTIKDFPTPVPVPVHLPFGYWYIPCSGLISVPTVPPFSPTPSPPLFATVDHRPNLAHLPRPRLFLNRPFFYNTQPRISHISPRQAYHSHSALYNTNPPCGTKRATQACVRAETRKNKKKDTS